MALLGAVALIAASAGTPVDTGAMKVFGHSIKNGHLVGQTEIDLLRHECSSPPCVITQMHCPSADGKYDSVVKLYIDGETMPSIAVTLKELALVGHLAGDEPPPPPAPGPPAPAPHDPKVAPNYTEYTLGAMGATCAKTCAAKGLVCSPLINTGYGVDKGKGMQQHLAQFNASVTKCIMDSKPWWAPDQPGYVCGNDPNGETAHCVGAAFSLVLHYVVVPSSCHRRCLTCELLGVRAVRLARDSIYWIGLHRELPRAVPCLSVPLQLHTQSWSW